MKWVKSKARKSINRLKYKRGIKYFKKFTGLSVQSVISYLIGDYSGLSCVIVSQIITIACEKLCEDTISEKKKKRIAKCVENTLKEIKKHENNGLQERDDNFFDSSKDQSSKAQEIIESVLLKSADEYEHRKQKYLSLFLAKIMFSTEISADSAHYQLNLFQNLSYRQLCLLRLTNSGKKAEIKSIEHENRSVQVHNERNQIIVELLNLYEKRLIQGEIIKNQIHTAHINLYEYNVIRPETTTLDIEFGVTFYEFFELKEIPDSDINKIIEILKQ